tara:strand:- start:561 stop:791 length:231 start_codon:yes stop_codon:yes gene_type:complete
VGSLLPNLRVEMFDLIVNIQNEMEARYIEKSSLTNLFTEDKFWGWTGLLLIFLAIAAIFYFQFQSWEQEDQEQKSK